MNKRNLNQWIGEGNLSCDPTLRFTNDSNRPVTNFWIYIDNSYKSKKGSPNGEVVFKKRTCKVPVVAWAAKAEAIVKHYKKGDKVRLTGRLRTKEIYKDEKSFISFEIVADDIFLIQKKNQQD
jgi:single-stranded DNA-binding protein